MKMRSMENKYLWSFLLVPRSIYYALFSLTHTYTEQNNTNKKSVLVNDYSKIPELTLVMVERSQRMFGVF